MGKGKVQKKKKKIQRWKQTKPKGNIQIRQTEFD